MVKILDVEDSDRKHDGPKEINKAKTKWMTNNLPIPKTDSLEHCV